METEHTPEQTLPEEETLPASEAPYGYKADGTPRKKPGRKAVGNANSRSNSGDKQKSSKGNGTPYSDEVIQTGNFVLHVYGTIFDRVFPENPLKVEEKQGIINPLCACLDKYDVELGPEILLIAAVAVPLVSRDVVGKVKEKYTELTKGNGES